MGAAAGFHAGNALRRERPGAHEIIGVPFRVDIIRDRGDLVARAHALAECIHQRRLAGADRSTDTDAERAVGGLHTIFLNMLAAEQTCMLCLVTHAGYFGPKASARSEE